jgi:hypothetical protein
VVCIERDWVVARLALPKDMNAMVWKTPVMRYMIMLMIKKNPGDMDEMNVRDTRMVEMR